MSAVRLIYQEGSRYTVLYAPLFPAPVTRDVEHRAQSGASSDFEFLRISFSLRARTDCLILIPQLAVPAGFVSK